jgi:uncharacterized membrane protein HdeD (DUF308 family)
MKISKSQKIRGLVILFIGCAILGGYILNQFREGKAYNFLGILAGIIFIFAGIYHLLLSKKSKEKEENQSQK